MAQKQTQIRVRWPAADTDAELIQQDQLTVGETIWVERRLGSSSDTWSTMEVLTASIVCSLRRAGVMITPQDLMDRTQSEIDAMIVLPDAPDAVIEDDASDPLGDAADTPSG